MHTDINAENRAWMLKTCLAVSKRLGLPFPLRMQALALVALPNTANQQLYSSQSTAEIVYACVFDAMAMGINNGLIELSAPDTASLLVHHALKDVLGEPAGLVDASHTQNQDKSYSGPTEWCVGAAELEVLHKTIIRGCEDFEKAMKLGLCEAMLEILFIRGLYANGRGNNTLLLAAVIAACFCVNSPTVCAKHGPLMVKWLSDLTAHREQVIVHQSQVFIRWFLQK